MTAYQASLGTLRRASSPRKHPSSAPATASIKGASVASQTPTRKARYVVPNRNPAASPATGPRLVRASVATSSAPSSPYARFGRRSGTTPPPSNRALAAATQ